MATVSMNVVGFDELKRRLLRLARNDYRRAIRKGARAGAKIVQRLAKALAPVDTGALQKNVKVRVIRRSRKYIGAQVTQRVVGGVAYASFQEFGWQPRGGGPRVPGQFHTTDAFASEGPAARDEFLRVTKVEVDLVLGP